MPHESTETDARPRELCGAGPHAPYQREVDILDGGAGGCGNGLGLLELRGVVVDGHVSVKDDQVASDDDVETAGADEIGVTGDEEGPAGSRVRSVDVARGGVRDVVLGSGEAVAAEEEKVDALGGPVERGGFDQRSVVHVPVEDGDGVADVRNTVGADLLKQERRGHDGFNGVATRAAVADGVAVDLVHDVPLVRGHVQKAVGVDGAALGRDVGAGEWLVLGDVWTKNIL